MPYFLAPFLFIAVVGAIASLSAYLWACFAALPPTELFEILLLGTAFVLAIPTLHLQSHRNFRRKPVLDVAFEGCPTWMRALCVSVGVYAILNFVVFLFFFAPPKSRQREPQYRPALMRLLSGHTLWFYTFSAATLYSGIVTWRKHPARHCPNGHIVSESATRCEFCGVRFEDKPLPRLHWRR